LFDFSYLLYVGDRFGYKNFQPWLRIAASIVRDYPEIHIVCTGRPFNDVELRLIFDLHIEKNVHHFFASEESFGSLYNNAIAFVYPSEYEGFGIPILEAFAYGCPVMLNDASCFPEVGGDAVIYFKMRQGYSDFYDQFEYLYSMNAQDRSALIEKGRQRLQCFSWEKSARALLGVYHNLV
jgi:glycosyltransferase involved in cell wall biosynthesis